MALVALRLVKFESVHLDPDEDPLIDWLKNLNFWGTEVEARVAAARNHLPVDIELNFQEKFCLPFNAPTKRLFSNLICSDLGIPLRALGYGGCWSHGWEDPATCTGQILHLKLARVQDHERFKALKFAFDPRIQYLIGVRPAPVA